jgi:hypothetical protein
MRYRGIFFRFFVLIVALSMVCGCSTDIVSVGVRDTPAPQVIDNPPGEDTIPSPAAATVAPQKTVTATATITRECRDLATAADADRAFLQAMSDLRVYANISSIADGDCTIYSATMTSQMVSTSPKPRTPLLASARQRLLSAATECLDAENSASRGRVRDNLDGYIGMMSRYAYLVSSCGDRYGDEIAASLKKSTQKEGENLLRDTGSTARSFSAGGSENTTFAFSYSGSDSFIAMLQDNKKSRNIDLIANCAGSCEGKRSIGLEKGMYSLNVTAKGPWSVLVTLPQ